MPIAKCVSSVVLIGLSKFGFAKGKKNVTSFLSPPPPPLRRSWTSTLRVAVKTRFAVDYEMAIGDGADDEDFPGGGEGLGAKKMTLPKDNPTTKSCCHKGLTKFESTGCLNPASIVIQRMKIKRREKSVKKLRSYSVSILCKRI